MRILPLFLLIGLLPLHGGDSNLPAKGGAFFEMVGMLGANVDGVVHHTPGSAGFYSDEAGSAERFHILFQEYCTAAGLKPEIATQGAIGSGGVTFTSPILKEIEDRFFPNGTLTRTVFDNASTEEMLRYIVGAYLRFGSKAKASAFSRAHGSTILANVGLILSKLGCSDVKLYQTTDGWFPDDECLLFTPSPAVKNRLGLQATLSISEFANSQGIRDMSAKDWVLRNEIVWSPASMVDPVPNKTPPARNFYVPVPPPAGNEAK